MRETAVELGIPVFDPANANQEDFIDRLRRQQADLFVVCDFGQILSPECLSASLKGGINLHGSLLPKYRGAAPVNWPIYFGDTHTGVSVIHMTPRLDGGPVLTEATTEIEPDETAAELEPRLSNMGVPLVLDAIELLARWNGEDPIGQPQDARLATSARRLKKQDGKIDWKRSAVEIKNQIRAFQPWPGSFTFWERTPGKAVRLILHRVDVISPDENHTAFPGQIVCREKDRLAIATGQEWLSIQRVQPSGKKVMAIEEFLRGYPVEVGHHFQPQA